MSKKPYTFIGGPADGQRIQVPEHMVEWTIRSMVPSGPSAYNTAERMGYAPQTFETRYMKRSFERGVWCFVKESLNQTDVFEMLIDGYNPQKTRQNCAS